MKKIHCLILLHFFHTSNLFTDKKRKRKNRLFPNHLKISGSNRLVPFCQIFIFKNCYKKIYVFTHYSFITTDTFTPSEIAFFFVFRSLCENSICRSKCLNSRSFTNFSFGAVSRTPHARYSQTGLSHRPLPHHILPPSKSPNPSPDWLACRKYIPSHPRHKL